MTTSELHPATTTWAVPSLAHARRGQVLASALSQLLEHDRERPARWSMPAFILEVEAARARLQSAATLAALHDPGTDEADPTGLDFQEAARRLAREPQDVALAIRRLEITSRTRLPAWQDLLKRGLPGRPTALETALWFG